MVPVGYLQSLDIRFSWFIGSRTPAEVDDRQRIQHCPRQTSRPGLLGLTTPFTSSWSVSLWVPMRFNHRRADNTEEHQKKQTRQDIQHNQCYVSLVLFEPFYENMSDRVGVDLGGFISLAV